MIKIKHDFKNIPNILLDKTAQKQKELSTSVVIQARNLGKKPKGYREKYTRYNRVMDKLKDLYKHKCVYCETKNIEHAAKFQVEHYRPVGGLDIPKTNDYHKQGDCYHDGYYWLGNEWSNLLISCPSCNGKSAKSAKFFIKGKRIFDPINSDDIKELNDIEEPLLLHPALFDENDKPENHLSFSTKIESLGKMNYLSEKGYITISCCDLDRDLLIKWRYSYVKKWFKEIKLAIQHYEADRTYSYVAFCTRLSDIFNEIREQANPESEYSLWANFVNNHFHLFVRKEIAPVDFQDEIIAAFDLHKNGKLLG